MTTFWVIAAAALITALCTPITTAIGKRFNIVAYPSGRRQHKGIIPRLGGVAIAIGVLLPSLWLFWDNTLSPAEDLHIIGLLAGVTVATIVGVIDDWRDLSPVWQLGLQFGIACIAVFTEIIIERFTNPLTSQLVILPLIIYLPITAFWIMGMLNTVNWLDGLDGLATGVAAIAALFFAVHMQSLGQYELARYAWVLFGACLGFLPFNFAPASVFLGSAGALVIGYLLATLSILAPARTATALMVMAIPITDTLWLIFNRLRQGRSPLSGDRGHLHFRLLDRQIPMQAIVLGYWVFCAAFGALSLLLPSGFYKLIALTAVTISLLGVMAFLAKPIDPTKAKSVSAKS